MKIADMKVTELINEVGAGTPAPGGGAVAGLAGGVGVALTMMVNGLTLDKKGFENDRERLLDAIAKGNEELLGKINEALATISDEERLQIMEDVLVDQPSAE